MFGQEVHRPPRRRDVAAGVGDILDVLRHAQFLMMHTGPLEFRVRHSF